MKYVKRKLFIKGWSSLKVEITQVIGKSLQGSTRLGRGTGCHFAWNAGCNGHDFDTFRMTIEKNIGWNNHKLKIYFVAVHTIFFN